MIISENELFSIGKGITFIKAELKINNNYAVLEQTPAEFIEFCVGNNINTIFCQFVYYKKEKYIVTDELIHDHTENDAEFKYCKEWAEKWNAGIEEIDFDQLRKLCLAATLDSMVLICVETDEWMPKEITSAEDALLSFQDENEDVLLDLNEIDEGALTLIGQFKEVLINDAEFRYCTNKENRFKYIEAFFKHKNNKKYLGLVKNEKNYNKMYAISTIVDRIYTEYRNACYKAKVQVGDVLPADKT